MQRADILKNTLSRMQHIDAPNQILGRSQTIGCVAVEITQRCNLDCSLCYLSDHSQSVKDIPIAEVYRRLDQVVEHYGTGVNVQITGGDPTLRKHKELIKIVAYAASIGLYPALFTNGIAATRSLLEKLANAGLKDIAFHVDSTQKRTGFDTEKQLNEIRAEYIERARGLGLMVIFNTTIHTDNFHELPEILTFFRDNADVIGLASFNLQADTGRGEWGSREEIISHETVKRTIEKVAGKNLPWDAVRVGHSECHSYLPTLVANKNIFPVVEDKKLVGEFLRDFSELTTGKFKNRRELVKSALKAVLKKPDWWVRALQYAIYQSNNLGKHLFIAKGDVQKLTFFIQNFMDADGLNQDRVHACSFMVMTADGPVSMCEHNANRDDYILKPLTVQNEKGQTEFYEPLPAKKARSKCSSTQLLDTVEID
ncbi:radical SAM protein [Sessilibacter corallicola]|uniref:Radical SAM core domain-containing protein n=1 Tax=Sessilibacter corallicola TaxID=2904075 RepID=A0ABQ0A8K5_9GAMM